MSGQLFFLATLSTLHFPYEDAWVQSRMDTVDDRTISAVAGDQTSISPREEVLCLMKKVR